jgi:hypothetical protein
MWYNGVHTVEHQAASFPAWYKCRKQVLSVILIVQQHSPSGMLLFSSDSFLKGE